MGIRLSRPTAAGLLRALPRLLGSRLLYAQAMEEVSLLAEHHRQKDRAAVEAQQKEQDERNEKVRREQEVEQQRRTDQVNRVVLLLTMVTVALGLSALFVTAVGPINKWLGLALSFASMVVVALLLWFDSPLTKRILDRENRGRAQ